MIKKIAFSGLLTAALMMTIGGVAGAQEGIPTSLGFKGIATNITSGKALVETIQGIVDWIFVALLVAAVIFIVLAAFQFVTNGGDATAVSEARRKLMYAAIGIIVATLAKGIPTAIRSITGT